MADVPFIVLSAIVVLLNIVPLIWQIQNRNSGPICMGIWVILANLNNLINAIVWRNDAINRAPAWCDFSTKIGIASPIGIVAGNVCVTRFLSQIVAPRAKMMTSRDQRHRAFFDVALCFGLPIFVMATNILYQPIRFGISRTLGCQFAFAISWPTFVLWLLWAPLLALTAAAYGGYVFYRLLKHRRNFGKLVANSNSALTTSRFIRLCLLAGAYILLTVPVTIYTLILQIQVGGAYAPYNWDWIHRGYARRAVYYSVFTERAAFGDYLAIITAILVLVFFGFSSEALTLYANIVRWPYKQLTGSNVFRSHLPNNTVTLPGDMVDYSLQELGHSVKRDQRAEDGKYLGPFADISGGPDTPGLVVEVTRYERSV